MFEKLRLGIVVFALLLVAPAQAGDVIDTSIRQNFLSARALGMGNAFIALADDYNALLINPAGLARLETWQMNLSTEYAIGADYQEIVSAISDRTGSGETAELTDYLSTLSGQKVGTRIVPAAGFLVRPNMGVAFIPADISVDLAINGQGADTALPPAVDSSIYVDTTAAVGFARDAKVGNGRFSWGVTGKLMHRIQLQKSFSTLDLANSDTSIFDLDDADEGLGIDADVGVLWTPKLPNHDYWRVFKLARPTFGFVARNILDLGFSTNLNTVSESSGEPDSSGRTFDIGSRWEYPKLGLFRSRGLMDFRDIGHPNWSFYKGLHIGWELAWRMYDWWKGYYRFGINQGYVTFGASARLGVWNLDFATWGEEVGTTSNRVEDRRFMLKFNIEI